MSLTAFDICNVIQKADYEEGICTTLTGSFCRNWWKLRSAEFKPPLQAKRITVEHHLPSEARQKSFLILRRTVSVLFVLRPDWPYCALAFFTVTALHFSCCCNSWRCKFTELYDYFAQSILTILSVLAYEIMYYEISNNCWNLISRIIFIKLKM